jgi:uncharacterized protein YdaU (DUF1376 family)
MKREETQLTARSRLYLTTCKTGNKKAPLAARQFNKLGTGVTIPMHYYEFNIGDYMRDTAHLDEMEDLAYRRMLDLYYLKESPLPKSIAEIAKLIRMRTHSESIANVLREYFTLTDAGYVNAKANSTLLKIYDKSEKAKKSAEKRWENQRLKDANALPTQSERNANGMLPNNLIPNNPLPNNILVDSAESPQTPKEKKRFSKPTQLEVCQYMIEIGKGSESESHKFFDFYESKGWAVGKSPMKNWKASVRNWTKNITGGFSYGTQVNTNLNRGERLQQWAADATQDFKRQLAELERQESLGIGNAGD